MPIALEPFAEHDIDRLIGWIGSPALLMQWTGSAFTYPLTRVQLQLHLVRAGDAATPARIYRVIDTESRACIGHGELANIDRRNCSATAARILVGPAGLRGRGIGQEIMRCLLNIGFGELGLHRIGLNVFEYNSSAIRCYEKVGFRREGLLREARRTDDTFQSVVVMGILDREWPT